MQGALTGAEGMKGGDRGGEEGGGEREGMGGRRMDRRGMGRGGRGKGRKIQLPSSLPKMKERSPE